MGQKIKTENENTYNIEIPVVKDYNFPDFNRTVRATSHTEALNILNAELEIDRENSKIQSLKDE